MTAKPYYTICDARDALAVAPVAPVGSVRVLYAGVLPDYRERLSRHTNARSGHLLAAHLDLQADRTREARDLYSVHSTSVRLMKSRL